MNLKLNKFEEVWTADEQKLGLAQTLFHRTEDINPKLQLYATYLEIEDYHFGSQYFVPTDYIRGRNEQSGLVTLSVTMNQVMDRTWFRRPDFVARKQSTVEELPKKE